MSAYILVQGVVTDPQGFAAYAQAVTALVAKMGGRYIVLGGDAEVLEGRWPHQSLVVHEWPSREQALNFWHSPEYQQAKTLRSGKGNFVVVIADGLVSPRS